MYSAAIPHETPGTLMYIPEDPSRAFNVNMSEFLGPAQATPAQVTLSIVKIIVIYS